MDATIAHTFPHYALMANVMRLGVRSSICDMKLLFPERAPQAVFFVVSLGRSAPDPQPIKMSPKC